MKIIFIFAAAVLILFSKESFADSVSSLRPRHSLSLGATSMLGNLRQYFNGVGLSAGYNHDVSEWLPSVIGSAGWELSPSAFWFGKNDRTLLNLGVLFGPFWNTQYQALKFALAYGLGLMGTHRVGASAQVGPVQEVQASLRWQFQQSLGIPNINLAVTYLSERLNPPVIFQIGLAYDW